MPDYYSLGILFGLLVGAVIALVILLRRKARGEDKYDERQMVGRGKAFQNGFFTILVGNGLVLAADRLSELPGGMGLWLFGSMILGILAFALTAIHFDAYLSLTDTSARFYTAGGFLTLAMVFSAVSNLFLREEINIFLVAINLMVAVAWIVILSALWLHNRRSKEDEE